MKRIILFAIFALAILEPKEPVNPIEPIEAKPVLATAIKPPWTIGKTIVGYYQKVRMPDGTLQELKSKTPLDEKGWIELATKQWEATKLDEQNQPKPCPACGGTGFVQ
jgi:quinol-cytochrome oxidoreductase complex cytochrome b subunit